MNKQELLEKIKALKPDEQCLHEYQPEEWEAFQDGFDDGKCYVELIIEQLDEPVRPPEPKLLEPEKPVVPQYVADWIKWCKRNSVTLLGAMSPIDELGTAICNDKKVKSLDASKWATRNQETFAKAWLFGYEVEKEKLYLASFRDTNQYLGWNEKLGEWFMSCSPFTSGVEQTQETWEGVGIWNNPAFEIKEVDE